MELIVDIEANGLEPTKVHCASLRDAESGKIITTVTTPEELQRALGLLEPTKIIGHNFISYDWWNLKKLWDTELPKELIVDTLITSKLAKVNRPGGHSMAAYGNRYGVPKVEHEDWSAYTPAMKHRCESDTELNLRMHKQIIKELQGYSQQSIDLEHKVKFIIAEQERNGWLLDQQGATELLCDLEETKASLEHKVHQRFKPKATKVKLITPKINKDGSMSSVGLKFLGDNCLKVVGGEFTRIDFPEFNLGSRQQIGQYLIDFGWTPKEFTETGQPKVDETILENVQGVPEAALIAEFLMVQKRIAQVGSWLDATDSQGRVHGTADTLGAVTRRFTHSSPNMAQVPANYKPYGAQCRGLWIVPEGFKLVGTDAEQLELRMLAHYMNDEAYIEEILRGDVHTANMIAAGLLTRDQAKTFIYAFLYGAGDAKIGAIIGGTAAQGRALKQKFLRNTPALKALKDRVDQAAQRGWLQTIDGGRVLVRSPHAALNTLLQSAGAVVMKQALVNCHEYATLKNLDFKLVGNIHDEMQAEVKEIHAAQYAKIAAASIRQAGKDLGLRCPLAGQSSIGSSWALTH